MIAGRLVLIFPQNFMRVCMCMYICVCEGVLPSRSPFATIDYSSENIYTVSVYKNKLAGRNIAVILSPRAYKCNSRVTVKKHPK
jgi:hypothetical protein